MSIMVLFDFDGTLADTITLGINILNSYSGKFKYSKIDKNKNGDLSAHELIKATGIKFWKLPYLVWFFRRKLGEKSTEIEMIPGVKDLLDKLKESGQELGILTSNSHETVCEFLKRNGIESNFSYIKTKVPLFGKKKALSKAKRQLNADFVYVGDEIRDVEACRKTGTAVVSVAWGFNSADSLEEVNPDLVAKSSEEAVDMILKLANNL